ncbi:MAG: AMP-binding protein [Acidimicrobiia bacterium]|nr:AMP-binding protein [Acidimicrobiia bacterium]
MGLMDGTYYDRELETMPWSKVQAMTFEKAQRQIERVYEVSPYYRRKLDEAGVKPADIRHPDDLARIPFFEKEEERTSQQETPPYGGHLCVDPTDIVRVHASSGTTGVPTFFALTANDVRTWDTIMGRCFYTVGMRATDTYALLGNLSMFVGGIPAVTASSSIGATALPIGATAGTDKTLELVQALNTTVMGATPSFAGYLGELVEKFLGVKATELGIRLMTVGGEPGGQIPAVRDQIRSVWDCEIRDVMGMGEMAGACWAESDDESGMHFCGLAEVHLELIDHETGEPKPFEDGADGELVYTAVEREATPLLRFRSHDHVLVQMYETPSGRTAPRITTLGRTDDMLLVRGINVFPSAVRDVVASFVPETTGHIRIVLEKPGPLVQPPLPVEVEVASAVPAGEREDLSRRVAERIKSRLNFTPQVRLVEEGALPRTSLKTQYILKAYESQES